MVSSVAGSVMGVLDSRFGTRPVKKRVWEAGDESTSADRLAEMASASSARVRAAVAWNRNSTDGIVAKLAADRSAYVRKAAAANPNLPAEAAEALAMDADPRVRGTVIFHPRLPPAAVTALAGDPDPLVKHAAESLLAAAAQAKLGGDEGTVGEFHSNGDEGVEGTSTPSVD